MRNRLPRTLALAALLGPASCGPGSGPDGELRTVTGEGGGAASALPGPALDGTPWPGLGGSVSPDSFHAELTRYARGLARSAYAPTAYRLPAALAALSYDEYPRTSTIVGEFNTLPVEVMNTINIAATPVIYAIGTMTTLFSLAVIFASFLAVYIIQKRRTGAGLGIARKAAKADSS